MRAENKTRASANRIDLSQGQASPVGQSDIAAPSLIAPASLPPSGAEEMGGTQNRLLRFLGLADGDWLLLRATGSMAMSAAWPSDTTELPVDRCAWARSVASFTRLLRLANARLVCRSMSIAADRVTPIDDSKGESRAWKALAQNAGDPEPRLIARRVLCLRFERDATDEVLSPGACTWALDDRVQAAVTALARALGDEAALGVGASDDAIRIFVALDDLAPSPELATLADAIVRAINRCLQNAGFGGDTCQIEAAECVPLYGTMEHHLSEDLVPAFRRTAFRCGDEVRRLGLAKFRNLAARLSADADSDGESPASAPSAPIAEEAVGASAEVAPAEPEVDDAPELAEAASSFEELLAASGLSALERGASLAQVGNCLRCLTKLVGNADRSTLALVRSDAVRRVSETGATDAPARLVDAYLAARVPYLPKPHPEVVPAFLDAPVDGAALVEELVTFCGRFAVLPPHAAVALALWIVHSRVIDASDRSPRLCVLSPTTQCGKGTVLAILAALVARPEPTVNAKASTLRDLINEERPTLLIGAARARGGHKSELLDLIEQGYLRTGMALRRVGNETVRMRVFGAVAIAAIGSLPPTLLERAILIRMKRCTPGERIEPFDPSAPEVGELGRKCVRWTADHRAALRHAQPAAPKGLDARQAEVWMPLLAIAEAAGGTCVENAAVAAIALSAAVGEDGKALNVRLLSATRDVLDRHRCDRISSDELVEELNKQEGQPWADTSDARPLTQASLAAMLRPFEVFPKTLRIEGSPLRGYKLEWFADAFERYLPARDESGSQGATGATRRKAKGKR
jgi:hypothetical protein